VPIVVGGTSGGIVPNLGMAWAFYVPTVQAIRYVISGVTYDKSGTPLGGCTVQVFSVETPPVLRGAAVSLANGTYSIEVTAYTVTALNFQAVAYLPGSPDVAGVTVNTLVPALG
jgi:hypothetical protein